MCPGSSIVSCSSTVSPVGSTPCRTARDSPFGPVFTTSWSNGYERCAESTGSAGAAGAARVAEPVWPFAGNAAANAAKEDSATQRSRRFMFIMHRILLRPADFWHLPRFLMQGMPGARLSALWHLTRPCTNVDINLGSDQVCGQEIRSHRRLHERQRLRIDLVHQPQRRAHPGLARSFPRGTS